MGKYEAKLLTPSLLNSWKWFMECPGHWKDRAYVDLSNYLNRVPMSQEKKKAIFDKGNRFERQVISVCRGVRVTNKMPTVDEVAKLCMGGRFQRVTKFEFKHPSGITFMIYGKKDVDFDDRTIDIKTTGEFKDPDYYTSSYQHRCYLYTDFMSGKPKKKFTYVITDFESVYEIDIPMPDIDILRKEVFEMVDGFYNFLTSKKELENAYFKKFCR